MSPNYLIHLIPLKNKTNQQNSKNPNNNIKPKLSHNKYFFKNELIIFLNKFLNRTQKEF